jgi:hypothetical protein
MAMHHGGPVWIREHSCRDIAVVVMGWIERKYGSCSCQIEQSAAASDWLLRSHFARCQDCGLHAL